MPSTCQPELFPLPAAPPPRPTPAVVRSRWEKPKVSPAQIAGLEARLRGRGWVKRADLGVDERELRLVKEASGGAILAFPGSPGYRLFDEASRGEWDAAEVAITRQIEAMVRVRGAYRRRRQRIERRRLLPTNTTLNSSPEK